jgi:hypothetical protein
MIKAPVRKFNYYFFQWIMLIELISVRTMRKTSSLVVMLAPAIIRPISKTEYPRRRVPVMAVKISDRVSLGIVVLGLLGKIIIQPTLANDFFPMAFVCKIYHRHQ